MNSSELVAAIAKVTDRPLIICEIRPDNEVTIHPLNTELLSDAQKTLVGVSVYDQLTRSRN